MSSTLEIVLPVGSGPGKNPFPTAAPPDTELGRGPTAAGDLGPGLSKRTYDEIAQPLREAIAASGLNEDEIMDLFEGERRAMRDERNRAAGTAT